VARVLIKRGTKSNKGRCGITAGPEVAHFWPLWKYECQGSLSHIEGASNDFKT